MTMVPMSWAYSVGPNPNTTIVPITTGHSILAVGLILTFFGLATSIGGRYTGRLKQRIGNKMLLYAGILGAVFWMPMRLWRNWVVISFSLVRFGLAWVLIQPVLVNVSPQFMPKQKGTVMSLVSFNMFVGGGIGTQLFGYIQDNWGFSPLFVIAGILIVIAGALGTISLNRYGDRLRRLT